MTKSHSVPKMIAAIALVLIASACGGSDNDKFRSNREPLAFSAVPQIPTSDQGFRYDAALGVCRDSEGKRGLNLGFRGECGGLHRAKLARANFSGMSLKGAALNWADLSGANLSGADLEGADLTAADLSDATLTGARLSGATLRAADLRRATLAGADFGGATFSRGQLPEEVNLEGALCDAETGLPSGWVCVGDRVERAAN